MREILFRGKREDNGEWIEGYLVRRPSAIQVGEHYSPFAIDRPPKNPDDSGEVRFVDGNTVGQFTGLTDKNGRKIFEGDIVKGEFFGFPMPLHDYVFTIGWHEDVKGYNANYFGEVVVIGNIYDNPELREVE